MKSAINTYALITNLCILLVLAAATLVLPSLFIYAIDHANHTLAAGGIHASLALISAIKLIMLLGVCGATALAMARITCDIINICKRNNKPRWLS